MAMRRISTKSEERQRHDTFRGLQNAFAYAEAMVQDGKLTAKDLDDLHRIAISERLKNLSMDDYVALRKNDDAGNGRGIDDLRALAGPSIDDEDSDPRDVEKRHNALVGKVVGELANDLWMEGAIDDAEYVQHMEPIGLPRHVIDAREKARMSGGDTDVGTEALETWAYALDRNANGEPIEPIEAADPNPLEVSPQEVANWHSRQGESRADTPSNRAREQPEKPPSTPEPAIVRERVVDMPST